MTIKNDREINDNNQSLSKIAIASMPPPIGTARTGSSSAIAQVSNSIAGMNNEPLNLFKSSSSSSSSSSSNINLNENTKLYLLNQSRPNQIVKLYDLVEYRHQPNTSFNLVRLKYAISSYREFISGYFAACTSVTLLFPLNKIIFRQILDGISFKQALYQIRTEGLSNIYRGLLPPLLQKSTSYSIMFGTQCEYYLWLKRINENSKSNLLNSMDEYYSHMLLVGISGALAGLTEATLTPFERVQAVLQMQKFHDSYKHTLHVFQEITKNQGFKELYRGYSAICVRNSLSNLIFFTTRTHFKSKFPHTKSPLNNAIYDFLSGGLIGAFVSTIFYPLNVIKSHMQAKVGGEFHGIYSTFRLVYESRDRSLQLLYKGVGSNFTRAILSWGLTNAAYEFTLYKLKYKTDSSEID